MGARGEHLAEFELCVLAALAHLGGDADGGALRREIEQRARRSTAIGAVYATLARLELKGLVRFYIEGPRPTPGGRARKRAVLTAAGRRSLQRTAAMFDRMLDGLTPRVAGERA
jgi:PadR family transcriptional regulator PadR